MNRKAFPNPLLSAAPQDLSTKANIFYAPMDTHDSAPADENTTCIFPVLDACCLWRTSTMHKFSVCGVQRFPSSLSLSCLSRITSPTHSAQTKAHKQQSTCCCVGNKPTQGQRYGNTALATKKNDADNRQTFQKEWGPGTVSLPRLLCIPTSPSLSLFWLNKASLPFCKPTKKMVQFPLFAPAPVFSSQQHKPAHAAFNSTCSTKPFPQPNLGSRSNPP